MTKLTSGRDADRQEGVLVDVLHGDNTIYRGAIVTIDPTTGYAHAAGPELYGTVRSHHMCSTICYHPPTQRK